jgi:hypothetical protein
MTIRNAGLVLANPFLPQFFRSLDLLEPGETRQRIKPDKLSRAVHLLQHLVDGRLATGEALLPLNKVLCGVPLATPVDAEIAASEAELSLCDRLPRSMIANWPVLQGTSVTGLRETFLQRDGTLERVDGGWRLRVQHRAVDALVGQIPWNIAVVFLPWMPEPLHVSW